MSAATALRRSWGAGLVLLAAVAGVSARPPDHEAAAHEGDGRRVEAGARLDRWQVIGPGGGGATLHPAISPHDPRMVLVACDMTGAYITYDAGESWRMFNLGADVSSFAFDPANADVIYAATAALWKSADRGRTWRMVYPDPARTREVMAGDHADYALASEDPLYPRAPGVRVQGIAVSRTGVVSIAVSAGGRGTPAEARLLSSESGRGWTAIRALPPERVLAVAVDTDGKLAVATTGHVLRQRGESWTERGGPPGAAMKWASIAFDDRGVARVYALTDTAWLEGRLSRGVFVSPDEGVSWREALSGVRDHLIEPGAGSPPRFTAISASAGHPHTAYLGFEGLQMATGPSGRYNGIARTDDGGRTWRIVHRESTRPSSSMTGSWVDERAIMPGPDVWFDAPYDLAASPTRGDLAYVTDLFRTYRTEDGGATWVQVHSRSMGPQRWTTRGLDVTTAYGVHFDPHDTRRVFISYTDIGLFRSEDGGRSWTISTIGVPQTWRNTTYWVVFDPAAKDLMWGAFSGTHDLPRPKMWRSRDPSSYKGGVGVSRDGGRTWTPLAGLPEGAVTHLWLDERSPARARTLYACMFGRGVYKSTDGGATWTARNDGLPGDQPFAWRIIPSPDNRLYLIVSRRSENGRIGDAGDGGLYVSDDGAEHWRALPLPPGTNGPTGLLVDPSDPARLYLSAWGVHHPDGDTGGGLFLSEDRGARWRSLADVGQHVYDVTIDRRAGTLYACGFDQGAWRSRDRGAAWTRLRGFNFKWGHRVIPDPRDPESVYIATFGGSVWHGPAAGDPTAVEDVVVPATTGG